MVSGEVNNQQGWLCQAGTVPSLAKVYRPKYHLGC